MLRQFLAGVIVGSLLAAGINAVDAAEPATPTSRKANAEASIPFANRGGIRDWQVENDSTLLIQDRRGQWYRARLQVPAGSLAYADRLGFATGPSGTLEKFGSVVVGRQKYPIISLTRAEAPAKGK